ncbi:putative killer cell immunoglobulin-like receptor-like protein KIR3DX1 [Bubalus bubalis]|uniref:putative killer cell immunoglobulin-like receptor-like protein KIR3DX1 n=1 Tax=Bubalus bubalis TaxID=89462 RepID=UPI001E1B82E9|nr:putative killer cell immunoglobulin-like receptor-like protein KIR3DX1 [Bubalus bubalis]
MCPTLLSLLSLGEYEKLSLSAWPSPVVPLGQTVTLWCHSRSPLKRFTLFKTDERRHLPVLQGRYVNNFTLGPVTREHAGFYMCSRAYWSAPSDPLQIVVSGVFTKPSISAHPGPLMQRGENVALRCHSLVVFDKFILHQESSTGHFQICGEMFTGGHATADFVIGPMTLATVGSYRCYGSLSSSPYEWSAPSDPVDIVITELPSSVSSTLWYQTHLQSSPWVIEMEVDTLTLLSSRFNASSAQRGGRGPSTLCAKESLPAPGGVQGSTEHTLKKEVVKDPDPLQVLAHQPWIQTPQKFCDFGLLNVPVMSAFEIIVCIRT